MREGLNRLRLAPAVTEPGRVAASLLLGPANPEKIGPEAPGNPEEPRGLTMVGATGFEPATTCTPSAASGSAPIAPSSTESQPLDSTERAMGERERSVALVARDRGEWTAPELRTVPVVSVMRALKALESGDSQEAQRFLRDALRAPDEDKEKAGR